MNIADIRASEFPALKQALKKSNEVTGADKFLWHSVSHSHRIKTTEKLTAHAAENTPTTSRFCMEKFFDTFYVKLNGPFS